MGARPPSSPSSSSLSPCFPSPSPSSTLSPPRGGIVTIPTFVFRRKDRTAFVASRHQRARPSWVPSGVSTRSAYPRLPRALGSGAARPRGGGGWGRSADTKGGCGERKLRHERSPVLQESLSQPLHPAPASLYLTPLRSSIIRGMLPRSSSANKRVHLPIALPPPALFPVLPHHPNPIQRQGHKVVGHLFGFQVEVQ